MFACNTLKSSNLMVDDDGNLKPNHRAAPNGSKFIMLSVLMTTKNIIKSGNRKVIN